MFDDGGLMLVRDWILLIVLLLGDGVVLILGIVWSWRWRVLRWVGFSLEIIFLMCLKVDGVCEVREVYDIRIVIVSLLILLWE